MAGDYSRITFDPKKHYTRVLMQQGRVQLDADWNEQGALIAHRIETEAIDVIGVTGAPKKGGNFLIGVTPDGSDLTIAPGRIYVDGLLCELEATPVTVQAAAGTSLTLPGLWLDGRELAQGQWLEVKVGNNAAQVLKIQAIAEDAPTLTLAQPIANTGTATVRRVTTYLTQPDPPDQLTFDNVPDGRYLVYLDVFEREISAIDDPTIREIALGGPDTARRLETVWRVALLQVGANATCDTAAPALANATRPTTGQLAARTEPPDDEPDPCLLPPSAGYRGLENQLYRIEIQNGGQLPSGSPPTFKWSRDNGTIEAAITNVSGATVTVSEVGKDDVLRFNIGDWVEIVDDASVLSGTARALVLIDDLEDATRVVTFAGAPTIPPTGTKGLRLRKWDQNSTGDGLPIPAADTWIDVEAGVQVLFTPGLYHSGDYWVVPARTAIADILWPPFDLPATSPVPQPPLGVRHHYARLAIVSRSGEDFTFVEDCRELFPPLTDIWAEDVNFDNTHCQLQGAETVQDAIDALCERSDIRTHNKFLHGWGVVCGLQVRCLGDTTVRVLPGYALTCEGDDIHLRAARTLDINTLPYRPASLPSGGSIPSTSIPSGPPSLPPGLDEVCLVLERGPGGQPQFRLTDHNHKDTLPEILDGTLLMDFYEHCLKPYSDYFRDNLDPRDTNPNIVNTSQQRVISVWNLLIQLWNPTNGGRVYLSQREHDLLVSIYNDLRELAASSTFCELLGGLREPPAYPFANVPMRTIFGKNSHTRLRVSPDGRFAVTVGAGDKVDIFQNGVFIRQYQFYVAGATVRDVAFTTPTRFAAVATLPGGGSAIASHEVLTGGWTQQTNIPGHDVVTLGFASRLNQIFGVSLNRGLMRVTPGTTPFQVDPVPHAAKGHLILFEEEGRAALSSRTGTDAFTSPKYNSIAFQFLQDNVTTQLGLSGRQGDDDLAHFGRSAQMLAIVVDPMPGEVNKQLMIPSPAGSVSRFINLGENTKIRLTQIQQGDQLAIAYEDSYRVGSTTPNAMTTVDIPVQICPSSIATMPNNGNLLVLNTASRTLTEIVDGPNINALRTYRRAMLDAFIDLGAAMFQSLKDCFCEQLLIKCDTCDADDVIILACLELRRGRVHQICNWTGRRYVKTFRGVGYWLSLVPILPVLRWALEKFCCLDITGALRRFTPRTEGPNNFDCGDAVPILAALERLDFDEFRNELGKQTAFLGKLGFQSFAAYEPSQEAVTVNPSGLVGKYTGDVEAQLKSAGLNVTETEEYDPSVRGAHLTRALRTLRPGMDVTIVQRNGKVAYIRAAKGSRGVVDDDEINRAFASTNSDLRMLRADVDAQKRVLEERQTALTEAAALRTEVTSLKTELANLRAANQNAETLIGELRNANIAAESRIGELNRRTTELMRTAADVETLKQAVERLGRRPPNG